LVWNFYVPGNKSGPVKVKTPVKLERLEKKRKEAIRLKLLHFY
jgi:hypothetical protein